jgi:hypothetical protein
MVAHPKLIVDNGKVECGSIRYLVKEVTIGMMADLDRVSCSDPNVLAQRNHAVDSSLFLASIVAVDEFHRLALRSALPFTA